MIDSISNFFRNQMTPTGDSETASEHRLQVATCALLLETAHADEDFSADEQDMVRNLVRNEFQLTSDETDELIALADKERQQSTDLYQFTRLIADNYTRSQKLVVLESLWRVVYSDGQLEAHEDALMHKLAKLLGLKHNEMIALKLRVKSQDQS
jgi:uncharacterized tellurite resistance protein B-like protein